MRNVPPMKLNLPHCISRHGRRLASFLSLATVLLGSSCADETPLARVKQACSLSSDCTSPLVCAFQRCHAECKTSADCADGARCVQSAKPYFVCQTEEERTCVRNSDCQGTQTCARDRQCRDACVSTKDCPTNQVCAAGVCADTRELVEGALKAATPTDGGAGNYCSYASECPGDLICRDNVCRVECLVDKDCDVGFRCEPRTPGDASRCLPGAR